MPTKPEVSRKKTHVFNRCGTPRRLLNGVHLLTCLPFGWDPHRCAASWPLRCQKEWVKIATSLLKLINPEDQVIKPVFCVEIYSHFNGLLYKNILYTYIYIYIHASRSFCSKKLERKTTKKRRTKCEVLVTSIHRLLY